MAPNKSVNSEMLEALDFLIDSFCIIWLSLSLFVGMVRLCGGLWINSFVDLPPFYKATGFKASIDCFCRLCFALLFEGRALQRASAGIRGIREIRGAKHARQHA
ncbi:MAG: hypothetical protein MUR45_00940, partial [OM182 bacterium]|nr:hypothetical protein [OM182 bacterium]